MKANHEKSHDQFKAFIESQTVLDDFIHIRDQACGFPKSFYKILITGPYQSGKTSFIRGLDNGAINMGDP